MKFLPEFFPDLEGFDWDEGNSDKNLASHGVSRAESEQVFLNRPLLVSPSSRPGVSETRHLTLGRTDAGRLLAVVFTVRGKLLRVISSRDMSERERKSYGASQAD